VLIEVAQNAHNDIVMIFFMLAAVWALTTTRRNDSPLLYDGLVCLFLALSVLTKFITIVIVPFFLLALMSRGQRWPDRFARLIGFGLLIGALVVIGTLPLWPGWDQWAVVQGADSAGRSILALLVLTLRDALKFEPAFDVARKVLLGLWVLIYTYALWRLFKIVWQSKADRSKAVIQHTLASSFLALFWLLLLVMPIFHAWYLLWCFPLAVLLLPQRRPLQAVIVFSITALYIIPYFETIRVWVPELLRNPLLGHIIGVTLLTVPPIVTLLWPRKHTPAAQLETGAQRPVE
jgi:4-amino-4-deoxy-L-arabinose transferase-like glycosyltransferase